jgi:hypothetical protein
VWRARGSLAPISPVAPRRSERSRPPAIRRGRAALARPPSRNRERGDCARIAQSAQTSGFSRAGAAQRRLDTNRRRPYVARGSNDLAARPISRRVDSLSVAPVRAFLRRSSMKLAHRPIERARGESR